MVSQHFKQHYLKSNLMDRHNSTNNLAAIWTDSVCSYQYFQSYSDSAQSFIWTVFCLVLNLICLYSALLVFAYWPRIPYTIKNAAFSNRSSSKVNYFLRLNMVQEELMSSVASNFYSFRGYQLMHSLMEKLFGRSNGCHSS